MKRILLIFILSFIGIQASAQDYFITTWKTDNPGDSNDTSITIPTFTGETYNYDVDWNNNGNWETGFTGDATHDYGTAGTYTVAIRGDFPRIYFNNAGDREKILSIEQWGTNSWSSMNSAFYGCSNLMGNATDTPDLSVVTDMYAMFAYASAFNQDIGNWDVGNVTDMSHMFYDAIEFNQDIGNWDVGNVTNMESMFGTAFFADFNQDISGWNVANVTNMSGMFYRSDAFNQDIGGWDVGNVTDMSYMFAFADAFNQDIGNWNVGNVTDMVGMFDSVSLSTTNYDALLNGWSTQTLQSGVYFSGGDSQYCNGEAGRDYMINTFGWTIDDVGREASCNPPVEYFITTWKTDNSGSSNDTSITIPTFPGETYNYDVDWNNDGVFTDLDVTGDITHDYGTAGTYTVAIRGDFPHIYFNDSGDEEKILSIEQWGVNAWSSMNSAFMGCENLVSNATDTPNLSLVSDMYGMFAYARKFNGDANMGNWNVSNVTNMYGMFAGASLFDRAIGNWDVSNVTNMENMFSNATAFNQDISGWNVGNVTNMNDMFNDATVFNQDISGWNVGNVTNMSHMFSGAATFNQDIGGWNVGSVTDMLFMFDRASAFNQDISGWNVGNVTNMSHMFERASAFNQDIGNWNVGNVIDMELLFYSASAFNQDIGNWNVAKVTNMNQMFAGATVFNQDIGGWNVGNVTDMIRMFEDVALSTANYDALLNGWSTQTLQSGVNFDAESSEFCSGETARNTIIDTFGWTINDAGREASCNPPAEYFITTWKTDNHGSSNATSITIPTFPGETYSYDVDWNNDGVFDDLGVTGDITHDYGAAGTYTVAIRGDFPRIYFDGAGDAEKILSIEQWGTNAWSSMNRAFYGCTDLQGYATDTPDLSAVTDMGYMFGYTHAFNQDIGNWNVDNVTNMYFMFGETRAFNQDIGNWNVGNVTDMTDMFSGASAFNQDISGWNVGSVTNMSNMFSGTATFNQDIGGWNVGSVTNMSNMFKNASAFDQNLGNWNVNNVTDMNTMFSFADQFNGDIGDWNVSNVTDMHDMFYGAFSFDQAIGNWNVANVTDMNGMFAGAVFNQDISGWDVGNVTNMVDMFWYASAFDQNIGNWNVSNVESMGAMFEGVTLSTANYDALLNGWSTLTLQNGVAFFGGDSHFCNGEAARGYIISTFGWSINDGGQLCLPTDYFITTWKTDNLGTSNDTSISIPTTGTNYNYDVDWGDGNGWQTGITGSITHNYGTAGTYTVTIRGNFPRIFFNNAGDRQKILSIEQWGINAWNSMNGAFYGCTNLVSNASDAPNLSQVTDMSNMFRSATSFNGAIGNWDVSNVTDMSYMFRGASAFNGNISNWDVGNVSNMRFMLSIASAFDQDLGTWNVANVTDMTNMFLGVTLSTVNYDALLNGWNTWTLQNGVNFSAGNSKYCNGHAARENMINTYGWNIVDGGSDCLDLCGDLTEYAAGAWSNGPPTTGKMAVFADNYDTNFGDIDACAIVINAGVTVTVSEGTTIRAQNEIEINGELIFVSSIYGNGELANMGPNASVIGDATVQRYMKNRRSYRMVSSAVTTPTSIHDNWQEGATSNTDNPNAGFGTHITGTTADQTNGFDGTGTGNPSMFTVNVIAQQFEAIANTNVNTLTVGDPYLLFVRGDRSIDLTDPANNLSSSTVLRATGEMITGTNIQNFATQAEGDFVMFGNPYQSAVNINTVLANSTNLNTNHYYVYDPNIATYGGYTTVNLVNGSTTPPSVANQYLQPGQGAQVATLADGPSAVIFNESDKTPGQFTDSNRNPLSGNDMLRVQLYTTENFNNGGSLHDGFGIIFGEANNNGLTSQDAIKPMNFYENLGINHDGTYLSLEYREMPQPAEVYTLYSAGYQVSEYTLEVVIDGLETSFLYLDDYFTGTSTLLEAGDNSYSFSVDVDDALSIATDRFSIRTEQRLGVDDNNMLAGIRLFPNPLNDDIFYINAPKLNGEQLIVSISDLTGRGIYKQTLKCIANTVTVQMANDFASGVYLVTLKHGEEEHSYRLIKE